jgi:signal transduction histidine kinase
MRNAERSPEAALVNYYKMDSSHDGDLQAVLLGMVGHDLRQPLQIVQSTYSLLRSKARTPSERAWLDRGQLAMDRLIEQLNRLLATLHVYYHTRTLELSSVAVAPLLYRLRNENAEAALRKDIDIRVLATSARIVSNPVLLEGVIRNLLTNAIKYTDLGGRILIGCRRSGSKVRIEVHDTGVGISSEQLPKIFAAFERLDPTRGDGLAFNSLSKVRNATRARSLTSTGLGSLFVFPNKLPMLSSISMMR